MTCLKLDLPIPQIPDIFLPNLSLNPGIDFGTIGISCCVFTLPSASINIPISIPPAALIPLITAMNLAITAAMPILDALQIPKCPLE